MYHISGDVLHQGLPFLRPKCAVLCLPQQLINFLPDNLGLCHFHNLFVHQTEFLVNRWCNGMSGKDRRRPAAGWSSICQVDVDSQLPSRYLAKKRNHEKFSQITEKKTQKQQLNILQWCMTFFAPKTLRVRLRKGTREVCVGHHSFDWYCLSSACISFNFSIANAS
jgi:hypothetical protein